MRNFLVMVCATSRHHKGTGELDVCQTYWCCYLITMLASFLGPRLRGDHHVNNKTAMVSLDRRGSSAGH